MNSNTKSRNAVVVVSTGERPWFNLSQKWMQHYCASHGLEFVVVNTPHPKLPAVGQFARRQNWGRAMKLGIGDLFDCYDRLLLLDDTCFVSPLTDNLFAIVPKAAIGCFVEGKYRVDQLFAQYLKFIGRIYDARSVPDRGSFFNAGVCVFSSCHKRLFELDRADWRAVTQDPQFPVQGYLCCRVSDYGIPLHDLGLAYNMVGSQIRRAGNILNCPPETRIFHLTSSLSAAERIGLAKQIDQLFEQQMTSMRTT